jgi:hypothetical protein
LRSSLAARTAIIGAAGAPSPRPQRDRLDVTDADELLDRPLRNALELATSIFLLTSLRLLGLQKKNIQ